MAAFNNLKQGTYKLSVAYNNGNKVMYGNTENIGTLVIKTKNNSDPAKGDVRLNSAFFYQMVNMWEANTAPLQKMPT